MREKIIELIRHSSITLDEVANKLRLTFNELHKHLYGSLVHHKSLHQTEVEELMHRAGQEVPLVPTVSKGIPRQAALITEEYIELMEALGFKIEVNLEPTEQPVDLVNMTKEACDLKVVTTGLLSTCGIPDIVAQGLVDRNNLKKFSGDGHVREDGKWVKPTDFKGCEDDIKELLHFYTNRTPKAHG